MTFLTPWIDFVGLLGSKSISDHYQRPCSFLYKNLFDFREKIDISDIADAAVRILIHARSMDGKVTALKLVDALLGKGACKIP